MPAIPHVDRLKTIYTAAKQLNFGFRMTGYPSTPQYNGWNGRAIPQLHRLTIRFCRKDATSAGIREFISKKLVDFAKENPATAVYVIPGRQCIPTFRGEYANGREVHINAKHFTFDQTCRHLNDLRSRSGEPIVKFLSSQMAEVKSTQGQWSPITWQNTKMNVEWSKLPLREFGEYKTPKISATDYILLNSKSNTEEKDEPVKPSRIVEATTST